jgi:hypothetical protein
LVYAKINTRVHKFLFIFFITCIKIVYELYASSIKNISGGSQMPECFQSSRTTPYDAAGSFDPVEKPAGPV